MINKKNDSMEISTEEENLQVNSSKICSVCTFEQAKKNYGALTCQSCKVFFRRSGNLNLNINDCGTKGECQINIQNRRFCRYCRLKKCFDVGMSKDLFRPLHTQIHSKKSQIDEQILKKQNVKSIINEFVNNRFQLTFNEQIILFNIIDSYDIYSPISNINQIIEISSNNPTKLRLKIATNNLIIIQTYFYSSIISFIKINEKFSSLSKNDRLQLIERNIHNLSGLNQLFIYDQIHFLNDPIEQSLILDQYGQLYLDNLLKSIDKMPSDRRIIKLFLIILTFSTCSDIVQFNINKFCNENNYLSNTLNLFKIQNIYTEILFKYLINTYGYEEATRQFQNIIQNLIQQSSYLQICLRHEKHYHIVETILKQVEQDLTRDDHQIMDSSN